MAVPARLQHLGAPRLNLLDDVRLFSLDRSSASLAIFRTRRVKFDLLLHAPSSSARLVFIIIAVFTSPPSASAFRIVSSASSLVSFSTYIVIACGSSSAPMTSCNCLAFVRISPWQVSVVSLRSPSSCFVVEHIPPLGFSSSCAIRSCQPVRQLVPWRRCRCFYRSVPEPLVQSLELGFSRCVPP